MPLSIEEVAWKLYNAAKLGAPSRGKDFDLRYEDVLALTRKGRCAMSGIFLDTNPKPPQGPDLPWRASLDRIDNSIGYYPDNIRVVCKIYNSAKYIWTDADVLRLCQAVARKGVR